MAEYIVEFDKEPYDQMVADGILKETDSTTLYGMPVRGEIIRCRDCKHSVRTNGDWICRRFYRLYGDPIYIESWMMHETQPDGFCAWAERDE